MATGLIATGSGVATINYTPTSNAKIRVVHTGAGAMTINGASAISGSSSYAVVYDIFAAAGVGITFTPPSGVSYVISAIEENS